MLRMPAIRDRESLVTAMNPDRANEKDLNEEQPMGPDFLCIGMPKAGTTWLYDQLCRHSDFWMPPIKELHYFDLAPEARIKNIERQFLFHDGHRRRQFLRFRKHVAHSANLDAYKALFSQKGSRLSGDITPAYHSLSLEKISAIREEFPSIKIIFLVRDPVERLWSFIRAVLTMRDLAIEDLARSDDFDKFFDQFNIAKRMTSTQAWLRWKHFHDVHVFFFDDIVEWPDGARSEIVKLLGANPSRKFAVEPIYNRNVGSDIPMQESVRSRIIEHVAEELVEASIVFGGPALEWRRKYLE